MDYKYQYESMKKMVTMYQDEIVPGLWEKIREVEKQMPKWIPVSERLPWEELKKEKSIMEHLRSAGVIGYISGAVFAVEVYFADDGNFYFFEDSDPDIGEDFDASNAVKVEYWMPLPEPPKENDNEM